MFGDGGPAGSVSGPVRSLPGFCVRPVLCPVRPVLCLASLCPVRLILCTVRLVLCPVQPLPGFCAQSCWFCVRPFPEFCAVTPGIPGPATRGVLPVHLGAGHWCCWAQIPGSTDPMALLDPRIPFPPSEPLSSEAPAQMSHGSLGCLVPEIPLFIPGTVSQTQAMLVPSPNGNPRGFTPSQSPHSQLWLCLPTTS